MSKNKLTPTCSKKLARFGSFTLLAGCSFVLVEFIFTSNAYAWGPGVHILAGNWLLEHLYLLPPAVAEALRLFPRQFLHGSLAPDIFIGKGSVASEGHSHNWETGLTLLEKAHTGRKQAFAYGYLCHLAADTVAHNVFVPETFATAPGAGRVAHVYLEMQADRLVNWSDRSARAAFKEPGWLSAERLLQNVAKQKGWKFWIKKHIFKSSILIGGTKSWRIILIILDSFFPKEKRQFVLKNLVSISIQAMVDLLSEVKSSKVLTLDPIGTSALKLANLKHYELKSDQGILANLEFFKYIIVTAFKFKKKAEKARDKHKLYSLELPEALLHLKPIEELSSFKLEK